MPIEMSPAEFDALVDRALDDIPDEIAALVRNVVVLVEADAPGCGRRTSRSRSGRAA